MFNCCNTLKVTSNIDYFVVDRLDSLGDSFTSSFESLTSTPVARRTLTFATHRCV